MSNYTRHVRQKRRHEATEGCVTTFVPFDCLVYKREKPSDPYVFYHYSSTHVRKLYPNSLKVSDIQKLDQTRNWAAVRSACFIVLVAGDTAQCISLSTINEKRTHFLYHGSVYDTFIKEQMPLHSEFCENYVPFRTFSTLCTFTGEANRYQSTISFESTLSLFPRQIREKDIQALGKWAENGLQKAMHSNVWLANDGTTYNERSLRPKTMNKAG